MRERVKEIDSAGGQVAVISFAAPEQVARFATALGHPFLWLSDEERQSYRALNMGRLGLLKFLSRADVLKSAASTLRGKPWLPRQGDLWQLGGDFVFGTDGGLTLEHRSKNSHDRPSMEALMAAFRTAAPARN